MRLDQIAYRVADKAKTAQFLIDSMYYKIEDEFKIEFDDGTCANCYAMSHPHRESFKELDLANNIRYKWTHTEFNYNGSSIYHLPPEIFVSEGNEGSIVKKWVDARAGIGGIHHLAYQVVDIESKVKAWKEKGIEFLTKEVIDCPDDEMRQIFTKPLIELGGVIVELIERGDKGFCKNSVKGLMQSTEEA